MEDEKVLASDEVRKDGQSVIRARVNEFKGSYYFDIREWRDTSSYEGPTKKGINVPLDRASSVMDMGKDVLETAFKRMDEHVKEERDREMKEDLRRLKRKYGSHT